ncbi:MAG: M23 family metallopeptidase [Firmicutes bacterium]|nr:M23 family metallopeptidase [Bacillota bacterium]
MRKLFNCKSFSMIYLVIIAGLWSSVLVIGGKVGPYAWWGLMAFGSIGILTVFICIIQITLGNYIFIEVEETGTYIVLGHLKNNSIQVELGDHIIEGMVIAQVGNTGMSSEPHLHIHHQKQDPYETLLLAEGLPLFFRDIEESSMPTGGGDILINGLEFRLEKRSRRSIKKEPITRQVVQRGAEDHLSSHPDQNRLINDSGITNA